MSRDKATNSIWVGRLLSALVIAFLALDGSIKLAPLQVVIDTFREMGWPTDVGTIRSLGVILLASTALYAFPGTAILGAILLTAYLGGAVATHVRIGSPMFTHTFLEFTSAC
ncbi:DoxX family protein [uncultured Rhodoblastus sp.]|uniref:DoxX family protein n=1 Tax=uncultured Rhodoblastus sp. TaxID=543037 RepID=UPI003145007A